MDDLLTDSVEHLFSEIATPSLVRAVAGTGDAEAMWGAIEASGFLDALIPESAGGAGLGLSQVCPLFWAAGRHVLPVPFVQTLLARAWLSAAGVTPPPGPIAVAGFGMEREGGGWVGRDIPFGLVSDWVLAQCGDEVALLPVAPARPGSGDGAEHRVAALRWLRWPDEAVVVPEPLVPGVCRLAEFDAMAYAPLMAGAADRVLAMTLEYVGQRTQFGKPIGRFQAVQNQISVLAEQAWAMRMASQLACSGDGWAPSPLLAALGKSRCSEASSRVADIAHAVHGAIGITEEYDLQLYTRLLREWRLTAGSESYWSGIIGSALLRRPHRSALSFVCNELSMGQV